MKGGINHTIDTSIDNLHKVPTSSNLNESHGKNKNMSESFGK